MGDRLSAQRAIQVLKSRWLVAGWRRGTDQPLPSPDHLCDPSGFSAKKKKIHSHPTHTGTPTSAATPPQLRNIHSCIQVLNHTSNVPRTLTSAHTHKLTHTQAHTDTHSYPLTMELWSSPILTSPIHMIHILKRATRTSLLLEPIRHTDTPARTDGARAHAVCTRRPSYTKHALMLLTQMLSCQTPTRHVHQAPTSQHSLPTPLPPPQTAPASHMTQLRCTHKAPKRHPPMYTHTRTRWGGGSQIHFFLPHRVDSRRPSAPAHNVPRPCVRNRSTGPPGVVGASSQQRPPPTPSTAHV